MCKYAFKNGILWAAVLTFGVKQYTTKKLSIEKKLPVITSSVIFSSNHHRSCASKNIYYLKTIEISHTLHRIFYRRSLVIYRSFFIQLNRRFVMARIDEEKTAALVELETSTELEARVFSSANQLGRDVGSNRRTQTVLSIRKIISFNV